MTLSPVNASQVQQSICDNTTISDRSHLRHSSLKVDTYHNFFALKTIRCLDTIGCIHANSRWNTHNNI